VDEELDEIKKKKLTEKQKELESKEIEKKLKEALRAALTPSAYDRLSNVAHANKELYMGAAQQVLLAYKQMGRTISESELITVLRALKEREEKDVSITFHKK
jgi:DNA-binding TFAR19-related protein (PDSD5 family)